MIKTKKLSKLCYVNSGGTPSRGSKTFYGGNIPWVKIGDFDKSDGYITQTSEYITKDGLKAIRNRLFPKNTLLFAMYGSVGKTAVAGVELSTNQAILGIQVKPEMETELDIRYLKKFIDSNIEVYKNRAVGGILKNLSATIVRNFNIPLPDLIEQKRIAQVLSDCEDLIAKRKESIALLDELVKSTFLEMFGDPVSNQKNFELVPFKKLGSIDRGVSKHRPRNAPQLLGGEHPLIQTGDVSNAGTYITKYASTYSDIGLRQSKKWPTGTLCITIAANIAKTGILMFDACFPDSIVGFIVNKESNNLYIHSLFGFLQRIIEKNAPAAAQKNINLDILRNLKVPKPPIELQTQFANIVKKIEETRELYQSYLAELENLYARLSQDAFKGDLDLSGVVLRKEFENTKIEKRDDEYLMETIPFVTTEKKRKSKKKLIENISDGLSDNNKIQRYIPNQLYEYKESLRPLNISILLELIENNKLSTYFTFEELATYIESKGYDINFERLRNLVFILLRKQNLIQVFPDAIFKSQFQKGEKLFDFVNKMKEQIYLKLKNN